jgi:heme exporter protein A
MPLVAVEGLVRSFGARRALDNVTFSLEPGDALALFGPNGAGKTTLLRVLAGLIRPSKGSAQIDGLMLPGDAVVRSRVGLISHQSMLYGALTARENVAFAASLYGLDDPNAAADRALDRLRIADRAQTPVRLLSRGLQQRVSIARAVVHAPRVLLADEPYSGLDAAGANALTRVLRELRTDGAAIVLVTHNITEGLAVASHAGVLVNGAMRRYEATASLDPVRFASDYLQLADADAA